MRPLPLFAALALLPLTAGCGGASPPPAANGPASPGAADRYLPQCYVGDSAAVLRTDSLFPVTPMPTYAPGGAAYSMPNLCVDSSQAQTSPAETSEAPGAR